MQIIDPRHRFLYPNLTLIKYSYIITQTVTRQQEYYPALDCLFLSKMIAKLDLSHGMGFPTMWYVRPAKPQITCAYAQSDQSLCYSFEHSRSVKLLTEHHLEFLSLTGGCISSSNQDTSMFDLHEILLTYQRIIT